MARRLTQVRRVLAIGMILAPVAWGIDIAYQAWHFDDGGAPLGATCMAVPAFVLLLCARRVWPFRASLEGRSSRHDEL